MRAAPRSEDELLAQVYRRSAEIRRHRAALRTGAGLLVLVLFAALGLPQLLGGGTPGAPRTPGRGPVTRGPDRSPPPPGSEPTPRHGGKQPSDGSGNGGGNPRPPQQPPLSYSEILSLPVSFSVANINRSAVACATDGKTYTIRGHLVLPRSARSSANRAVTIYLHPVTGGEWVWSLKGFPGYDFATEMARLGHVSLVIDRLGYDSSDRPQGFDTCLGADADITHQIIEDLRSGTYAMAAGSGIRFDHVALAGVSIGSLIVEVEVASFSDVDAMILSGWGDIPQPTLLPGLASALPYAARQCATGDQTSEPDGTGPTGYVFPFPDPEDSLAAGAYDPDPEVMASVLPQLNRDPCGFYGSAGNAMAQSQVLISTITARVLLIVGDHDQVVNPEGVRTHADRYVASDDVTVAISPRAGHAPMFDRSAPEYRRRISDWLRARGF